jgi:hypothetical protein
MKQVIPVKTDDVMVEIQMATAYLMLEAEMISDKKNVN